MELFGVFLMIFFIIAPIAWTVIRILRPMDNAAKARNLPFRFSISDFLCLFWVVQLPLVPVGQIDTYETEIFFWACFGFVWVAAPLIWVTCARALSKAGITGGKHRLIFLAIVVPLVYYGLFPFIWLSLAIIGSAIFDPLQDMYRLPSLISCWIALGAALIASGIYTPWLVRQREMNPEVDTQGASS